MSTIDSLNDSLKWRCIGPFRAGRVVAVAGHPTDMATFYFGACAGGVWKTEDAGMTWQNISDGYFNTSSIGALAVSEADPNVIYAGTGETTIRIDVSHGDGVYKSTNGGQTWAHIGLTDTRAIAKIRIHPQNPDIVYVAALGHPFGPNDERGVFRSIDGGETWQEVLYQSEKAGAIDLTMDPQNPRILYATIWEAYRSFWNISSGGPDSRLYKSTDGGDTWTDISQAEGLPEGPLGKMAVAVAPTQSGRVWALIEANKYGLYRSDDGGKKWQRVSDNRQLVDRAWYFTHLTADTQDADTVYVNALSFWKSIDGGATFNKIGTPHGDNHDLWIDPQNPRRMIQGNDGGANVSLNGGDTWSSVYNQPTAQFYHLDIDNQYPYRVYGTQQDNTSVSVPSMSDGGAILWADCYIAGTGESGYIAAHPDDANIVYVGAIGSSPGGGNALQRYDHRTRQIRLITTWPETMEGYGASDDKYRFAWTYPIIFSPHDTNTIYIGGNRVFKTTDEGTSWQPISPDLTRADPETLKPTGGPINLDSLGAETYATVYAFIESQHEQGVFWAGSDDGLIHLSRDGGQTWQNVTPADLPEWTMISIVEQSPHDAATVYVAATRYKLDDYQPYLYKTTDYGQTWHKITDGIPDNDFTRVIREDPAREGLLYAGTETGLYVSFDGGAAWEKFQLNLPVCPIHDMKIKNHDLVVATHGRSFWILDDLTPLHQLSDEVKAANAHLFTPRTTIKPGPVWYEDYFGGIVGKNYSVSFGQVTPFYESKSPEGIPHRRFLDAGQNPPAGVILTYYLQEKPAEPISLTFLTDDGTEINTFTSKPASTSDSKKSDDKSADNDEDARYLTALAGLNRFVWNMRWKDGEKMQGKDSSASSAKGPAVVPGNYQAQLTVGEATVSTSFDIVSDPRVSTTAAEFQAQFDLLMQIRNTLSEANGALNQIQRLQQQFDAWIARLKDQPDAAAIIDAAKSSKEKLTTIEEPLIVRGLKSEYEAINHGIRLVGKLASLQGVVASADFAPTQQSYEAYTEFSSQIGVQLDALNAFIESDLATFNILVAETGIAAVG